MAENKRSFLLYTDVHYTLKKLTNEQAGKLFKIILSYVNDENPIVEDLMLEIAFEPIKQSLKRDLEKYESICKRNQNNGLKGGRPRNKPKKPSGFKNNPNNPNNPNEPDNDNDNDNDKKIIIDYKFIVDNYHSLCPKMKKVEVLNKLRKDFMNARVGEFGIEKVIAVIRMAGESDFLNGKNKDAWKADFEWIIRPTNFVKILEGKYENKNTTVVPQFTRGPGI